MNLLRNYFWWTYERGSLHYDVMVTLILAFLFIAPHVIDFKDRPVDIIPLHSSEVLVKDTSNADHLVFEVRAADLANAPTDADRRATLLRIIEPIAGDVTIQSYKPVTDTHGAVVAYDATVTR
jgi:hypothetical protein